MGKVKAMAERYFGRCDWCGRFTAPENLAAWNRMDEVTNEIFEDLLCIHCRPFPREDNWQGQEFSPQIWHDEITDWKENINGY